MAPNRRGFPPGPDVEHVDFEDEAVWLEQFLEPGTHLVGHSYGGVIALLAAARRPELAPLADRDRAARVRSRARHSRGRTSSWPGLEEHWTKGPRDPAEFLRGFLALVGSSIPPGDFTPSCCRARGR